MCACVCPIHRAGMYVEISVTLQGECRIVLSPRKRACCPVVLTLVHRDLPSVPAVSPFPECPLNGILQHVTLQSGLWPQCVLCCVYSHVALLCWWVIPGKGVPQCEPIEGPEGCLLFPMIVNRVMVNICVQVLCERVFLSLGRSLRLGHRGRLFSCIRNGFLSRGWFYHCAFLLLFSHARVSFALRTGF